LLKYSIGRKKETIEDVSSYALEKPPNCLKCRHFQVTWDPKFPRACRVFGIKSKRMPSLVVRENTGYNCPSFEQNPRVNE
jgi:hypothetical protein